jgi:hypothetical protein
VILDDKYERHLEALHRPVRVMLEAGLACSGSVPIPPYVACRLH